MCGIAGELRFDGASVSNEHLNQMLSALHRRGPDGGSIYADDHCGLVHTRLAVIDLTTNGLQPMVDSALDLVLTFNGTIYNYRELHSFFTKQGYHFFSTSDSEVILKAYHYWQDDCVTHLDGDFAFAIWDIKKQELFLARDRMGIKPLYYAYDKHCFRFASTPQTLLGNGRIDTSIDPIALHRHLSLHAVVPAPRTLLRGVRKLMPAHTMTVDMQANHASQRYWDLHANQVIQNRSEHEWIQLLEERVADAVDKRFIAADVPVGVLLSGGLDSSLVTALLARLTERSINTYTIGFEHREQEVGNEFEYSDLVAEQFATKHHRFTVSDKQLFARLPEVVEQMSEPMLGQDCVAFYLLSERVRQDIKTVQSGQGADEVFAGYFWYPKIDAEQGTLLQRLSRHYFDRTHSEYLQTVCADLQVDDVTTSLLGEILKDEGEDINALLCADIKTLVVDDPVKRVDNMAMSWGVEARVPFLDYRLVELSMQIPGSLKLKQGGKYILRKLAQSVLPEKIIRRDKAYFPVPALKILNPDSRRMMCDVLTSRASRERGIFNQTYIDALIDRKQDQFTPIQGNKLWHCAVLEMWMQTHIDPL